MDRAAHVADNLSDTMGGTLVLHHFLDVLGNPPMVGRNTFSALRKLRPYRDVLLAGAVIFGLILVAQQIWVMLPEQTPAWKGITILWLAFPLASWAAILLVFRPGLLEMKRLVLFMIGTGIFLTILPELVVVSGDVGRMNTLYKFGVQSWILLGIAAAAGFGWILPELRSGRTVGAHSGG